MHGPTPAPTRTRRGAVTVEFAHGGTEYRLTKRFLDHPSAELARVHADIVATAQAGRASRAFLNTLMGRDPDAPLAGWTRYTAPTDTLHLAKVLGGAGSAAVAMPLQTRTARALRKAFTRPRLWHGTESRQECRWC